MDNLFSKVAGIEKMTLLDYKGKAACILFSPSCNYSCGYCYNGPLWRNETEIISKEDIIDYLIKRKNILDAVVFSGGECTIHRKYLLESAKWCKDNGYLVKIDTNGSNPILIKEMVEDGLIDYIALDYKYPDLPNEYLKFHHNSMLRWHFEETLDFLINEANIPFETRTTIHPDITDEHKANLILKELKKFGYKGTHYFQFFNECPETLGNVNQNPRRFRIEELDIPEDFKVEFRNLSANDRRLN